MNRKISRNEKRKYSNEEKLVFEEGNLSALINIAQEDDIICELLQNLWVKNHRFTS